MNPYLLIVVMVYCGGIMSLMMMRQSIQMFAENRQHLLDLAKYAVRIGIGLLTILAVIALYFLNQYGYLD